MTSMRRLAVGIVCALAWLPVLSTLAKDKPEPARRNLEGKVVPIGDLVKKIGSRLDPDAAPHWLALITKDNTVYPLIKDAGSRMFFKDKRLLNRPMKIVGRVLPGSHLLQVLDVQSIKDGKLCEVYYWCDICSIKRSEKNLCECCGGPMDLYEVPLKKKP